MRSSGPPTARRISELKGHGHGADIDSKGRIVVGNDDTGRVVYLDPNGNVVDAFSAGACSVTIDAADNLYSGGCGSDRINVFDQAHELIGSWSGPDMVPGRATGIRSQWRDPRP